jgi:tetratricopeptide (TPR) repeat protein
MRCGQCNAENKDDAKFCVGCGFALTVSCPRCEATMSSVDPFCSDCGYEVFQKCRHCHQLNHSDNRFCISCGSTLKTICISCGAQNPPGSKFCGTCAFVLTEPDPSVCRFCSFVNQPGELFCGNCKRQLLSDQEHHERALNEAKAIEALAQKHHQHKQHASEFVPWDGLTDRRQARLERRNVSQSGQSPQKEFRVSSALIEIIESPLPQQGKIADKGVMTTPPFTETLGWTPFDDLPDEEFWVSPETDETQLLNPHQRAAKLSPKKTSERHAEVKVEEETEDNALHPDDLVGPIYIEKESSIITPHEGEWRDVSADPETIETFYHDEVTPLTQDALQDRKAAVWSAPENVTHPKHTGPPPTLGEARLVETGDGVEVLSDDSWQSQDPLALSPLSLDDPMLADPNQGLLNLDDLDRSVTQTSSLSAMGLATFALASIEIAPTSAGFQPSDPVGYQDFISRLVHSLGQWVQSRGGIVESTHAQALFATFSNNNTVTDSALQALEVTLSLSGQHYDFEGNLFALKVGVDMESAVNRNPISSTTERNIAQAGQVVVSEAVYQLAQSRFAFESIGPLRVGNRLVTFYQVKAPVGGVSETVLNGQDYPPQTTALGQAPTQQAPADQAAHGAPISWSELLYQPIVPVYFKEDVPRTQAFSYYQAYEALANAISQFLQAGTQAKGQLLSISAVEGLGKSYILEAIHAQVNQQPQLAQNVFWMASAGNRATKRSEQPLSLWQDWLQGALGLWYEANSLEQLTQVIDGNLNFLYGENQVPEGVRQMLQTLWGLTPLEPIEVESSEKMGWFESQLEAFLIHLASQKPLVFIVDDIHQVDTPSLQVLFDVLSGDLLKGAVMMIWTHPPTLYPGDELADFMKQLPYSEMVIQELTPTEASNFLKEGPLFGGYDTLPPQLLERLVLQSKGVPQYLLETLRLFHHQGVLTYQQDPASPAQEGGRLTLNQNYSGALQDVAMPTTISEVMAQRFGFLSENARRAAQMAAVIGEKFPVELLQDCLPDLPDALCQDAIKELFDQGWIVPEGQTSGRFIHGLAWQAVYEQTLSPEKRIHLHCLVGEYLQELAQPGKNFAVNPAGLSYHSEQGQLLNRAFHYWNMTGVKSAQLGDSLGTAMSLAKALSLLPHVDDPHAQEWALQIRDNLAILSLKDHPEEAIKLLEGTARFYFQQENHPKMVETLGMLANCHENLGQFFEAMEAVEMALSVVSKQQYPLEYASLITSQMDYLYHLGKCQKAQTLYFEELEPLEQQYHFDNEPSYQNGLITARLVMAKSAALRCQWDGQTPMAQKFLEHAETLCQQHQLMDRFIETQLDRADIALMSGQYGACQQYLQGMLDQIEANGSQDRHLARWSFIALKYYVEHGDWQNAYKLVDKTIAQAEKSRDYLSYLQALAMKGRINWAMGNPDEGRQLFEQAIGLSSQFRFGTCALLGWRFLAELEASQGKFDQALSLVVRALDVATMPDMDVTVESILLSNLQSAYLIRQGNLKEAAGLLEPLWEKAQASGYPNLVAETAFQLGMLYRVMAQGVTTEEVINSHTENSLAFFNQSLQLWQQLGNEFQARKVDVILKPS